MKPDSHTEKRLLTVTPRLREVTLDAIQGADRHIRVTCGIRTPEEQRILVRTGKSRTLKSKHLPQAPDQLSHAVDLVLLEHGEPDWSMSAFIFCATRMKISALKYGANVYWGAIWDKPLVSTGNDLEAEVSTYWDRFVARHNRKPFIDAPHFQLGV